jgi:tRNA-dihydrouridine synthase B
MSGVTDLSMRRIARRFGASPRRVRNGRLAISLPGAMPSACCCAPKDWASRPHVVQIAGCEAYWMGEGARAAEAAGADIIDINMGCPAKRVTNGWSGSALMRDLDAACRLIEATVKATSVPVTLKTRLGWDHASHNAAELARRAQDLGVMLVTIHGRTRQQFYKGQADWRQCARCARRWRCR